MRRRRFGTLEWTATGISALIVLAAACPYQVKTPAAPGVICQSNLKLLALGSVMYANDYDDRLPVRVWKEVLWPYLRDERPFHDPVLPKGSYGETRGF